MATKIIYDIDTAKDIRRYISISDDVSFDDPSLKKVVMGADDSDLLRIGKIINCPAKIISVDIVNIDFLKRVLG